MPMSHFPFFALRLLVIRHSALSFLSSLSFSLSRFLSCILDLLLTRLSGSCPPFSLTCWMTLRSFEPSRLVSLFGVSNLPAMSRSSVLRTFPPCLALRCFESSRPVSLACSDDSSELRTLPPWFACSHTRPLITTITVTGKLDRQ